MKTLIRIAFSVAVLTGFARADGVEYPPPSYSAPPPPRCTPSRGRVITVYRYYPVYAPPPVYPVFAPFSFGFGFGPGPYWGGAGGAGVGGPPGGGAGGGGGGGWGGGGGGRAGRLS